MGLRTLCLAIKELTKEEYMSWSREYHEASIAMTDRAQKMDDAAEKIERDLTLIGCTAIEDKLQEGVPQTLETLAKVKIFLF